MKRDYITCPNCGGEVYRKDLMYLHDGDTLAKRGCGGADWKCEVKEC